MKRLTLFMGGMAMLLSLLFISSCEKDTLEEFLPSMNAVLKDGGVVKDSMSTRFGTKVTRNDMTIITGTEYKVSDPTNFSGKKLMIYLNDASVGTHNITLDASALLNLDLTKILSQTVLFHSSEKEYYILIKGELTITEQSKTTVKGSFNGIALRADNLKELSYADIAKLIFDAVIGNATTIEGDFNLYGLSFNKKE